jgi:hypothetical protein
MVLQSSWDFYSMAKEYIAYVQNKDTVFETESKTAKHHFPGDDAGDVKRIVKDLLDRGN